MIERKKQTVSKTPVSFPKQRSYHEIIEYLDAHWSISQDALSIERTKQLDKALGLPSEKVDTMLVAGTNGKSITIHLTAKLLKEEGLKVGAYYAPHILNYNERFAIGQEVISNKVFTEIANEVITAADQLQIEFNTSEILTVIALNYFVKEQVDVALLEVSTTAAYDPVTICNPKVATITRVTAPNTNVQEQDLYQLIQNMMSIVKKNTHLVSGDQNKSHLQLMQDLTENHGGHWAMPIRKLAPLSYPYEQLHGRCAALAERLAQMYVENYVIHNATIVSHSLLTRPHAKRGRPTLEEKRQSERDPKKTLEQFWKETSNELPSRFHLLDKEKPSILLDTADNIDAFKNLLLGIRLLHYQRPLKGLAIIVAAQEHALHNEEFLKLVRYFFKKTSGQLFVCPLDYAVPGTGEQKSWDVEKVTNDVKSMKVKARACSSLEEAFELAKSCVDERNGLVVVTGSQSIINNYWRLKGIKKF